MTEQPIARVISADSHVMEPPDLWWNALGKRFGERTPRLIEEWQGESGRFFYTGGQVRRLMDIEKDTEGRDAIEAGYLPEKRIAFQHDAGVSVEIIYTSAMLAQLRSPDAEVLQAAAMVYNDWLYDFCAYDSHRLVPIAVVPMHDPTWAVGELDRNLARGFRGAMINLGAPVGRPAYRDPRYDQFWARAAEAGIPITLHSGSGGFDDPFHFATDAEREEGPGILISGYNEIMVVLANDFIFGGILDRHPALKLVCSEFEISWIPYFMYRLEQMQDAMAHRLRLRRVAERAPDYMRRRVWHGVIDDRHAMLTIPAVGASQVLWGSDYPHVRSITTDTPRVLARHFRDLNDADRDAVVAGNAASLYQL
jgi:predicted TIM-barrel fold metal-dependent hydrolase